MNPVCFEDLKNKVALITGATGGLGSVIAGAFALNGCHPVICFNKNLEEAEGMKKDFAEKFQVNPSVVQLDITDPHSCRNCVERAMDFHGRIDHFINCVGIPYSLVFLEESCSDEIQRVVDVHFTGVLHMLREIIALFKKQRSGNIILLGSIAGQKGSRGGVAYAGAKSGLKGIIRALAPECAVYGIRINMISPGYMDKGMIEYATPVIKTKMMREIPLKRFGTAGELADLLLFMSSEKSAYITGQDISINGGAHLR